MVKFYGMSIKLQIGSAEKCDQFEAVIHTNIHLQSILYELYMYQWFLFRRYVGLIPWESGQK